MGKERFASRAKASQILWADRRKGEIEREPRKSGPSWVLTDQHRARNLFRADWWRHIEGKEHTRATSLVSSQCFAVNLFGPLTEKPSRGRAFVNALLPHYALEPTDEVTTCFEWSPDEVRIWLGEGKQPTQVDVCLQVQRRDEIVGYVMVEVKFTESEFGSCRGWNGRIPKARRKDGQSSWQNPNRTRCEVVDTILAVPSEQCWLAQTEHRAYWALIDKPDSTIRPEKFEKGAACPFRHGLYQLMRNRVLGDELRRHRKGAWVEFAVCRHPDNDGLARLIEPVAGSLDALEAFRRISEPGSVLDWNALHVVDHVASTDPTLADWQGWMKERYFPN